MSNQKDNLPEGALRTVETLDGFRFKLSYNQKFHYHIYAGMSVWARNLSLELGLATLEAISFVDSNDVVAIIKNTRTEFKRLEFARYDTPAAKHNDIVFNGIRRLEGYKLRRCGKNEVWTKAA